MLITHGKLSENIGDYIDAIEAARAMRIGVGRQLEYPKAGPNTMSKLASIVADSLRPNNAWLCPMRAADPKDRWKYYAVRFGFVVLIITLFVVFQHQPLNALRYEILGAPI